MAIEESGENSLPLPPKQWSREVKVIKRYHKGSKDAGYKLGILKFDPIEKLVGVYRQVEAEIAYQDKVRTGQIVPLDANGKTRRYNQEHHYALFDKLAKIGNDLLRYKYGRVPEQVLNNEAARTSLIVNLTKEGDVYTVNDSSDDPPPGFHYEDGTDGD